MDIYKKSIEVRWADLDPNFHMLHSRYYDLGAYVRTSFLIATGINPAVLKELNLGPILFREECVFRREILFGDKVEIDLELLKAKRDASRWTFRHHIVKNEGELCAVLTVDGAWIDTSKRKLTSPPAHIAAMFLDIHKADEFEWS